MNEQARKAIYILLAVFTVSPWCSAPLALFMGIVVALAIGNPFTKFSKKASGYLLRTCVVLLGFGMNFNTAMEAGKQGILFTVVSIAGTLALGLMLGRLLKTDKKISVLVSSGTAICGGSAIAAVSPVVEAEEQQMSVSLGVVFILNAIALFIFPVIGHALHLSQQQFGVWSAIAIHDTSSVVGAAGAYGKEALGIATTIKMLRTLWIIPVAMFLAFLYKSKNTSIKMPWFIGLYMLAMLVNTYFLQSGAFSDALVRIAKAGLQLTLFFIGSGMSKQAIRSVGARPFLQGVLLWLAISAASLWAVLYITYQ